MLVGVKEGRIADWKGGVKDWVIVPREDQDQGRRETMVNGIS